MDTTLQPQIEKISPLAKNNKFYYKGKYQDGITDSVYKLLKEHGSWEVEIDIKWHVDVNRRYVDGKLEEYEMVSVV